MSLKHGAWWKAGGRRQLSPTRGDQTRETGFLAPAGRLSKREIVELTQGTSVAQTRCDSKVPRTKDSTWGLRDSKCEVFIRYRRQT